MRSTQARSRHLRITIALSGLHRVARGAEVALEAIGTGLAERGHDVTLIGTGSARPDSPYRYRRTRVVERRRFNRWPLIGPLREPNSYEALTFVPGLLKAYDPATCDVTLTCGFPFENIALRRPVRGGRPAHVFITQNGDWPATVDGGEARSFSCDGLVCTNPEYLHRNEHRWHSALIPNAVDAERFSPGPSRRGELDLPDDVPIVLMVSALIPSKRVEVGVHAVAELDRAVLVVAGDGPHAERIDALGRAVLGDRYIRRTFSFQQMPDLYNSVDVFFHPTIAESFGNVYIEAMACGVPVVAHRSIVTEWIMGELATLVDTEDVPAVVAGLREMLDAPPPPASARDRIVSDFTWSSVAEQYERFLREVVSRR